MIFDKAVRRRQFMLPSTGHVEPNSPESADPAVLKLNPVKVEPEILTNEGVWPDTLEILTTLDLKKVDGQNVLSCDVVNDQSQGVVSFYDPVHTDDPLLAKQCAYEDIRFCAKAQTKWIRGNIEKTVSDFADQDVSIQMQAGDCLYSKSFQTQSPALLKQSRKMIKQDHWQTTVPKTGHVGRNIVPMLSYGGFIPDDFDIRKAGQTYACITSRANATSANLFTSDKLNAMKINPSKGGMVNRWDYRFIDPHHPVPSITEDIISGQLQLTLEHQGATRTYRSVGFRQEGQGSKLYSIIFSPMSN